MPNWMTIQPLPFEPVFEKSRPTTRILVSNSSSRM
ncbi:hypothetical protein DFJ66_7760 [Saccharothrix variisporea]|uniref:Uncharacterized protein n=1 Tax=Saccharothrix variisporea TaxID=543527 RepID=A0A495XNC2_9PSEU|nr:hypothetical protein DFJ66_7760 [Saccharothrix variisporea]